jgi:hypothetical protein
MPPKYHVICKLSNILCSFDSIDELMEWCHITFEYNTARAKDFIFVKEIRGGAIIVPVYETGIVGNLRKILENA